MAGEAAYEVEGEIRYYHIIAPTDWWDASGRNIRDYKYFKSVPKVIMRYIVRVKLKAILIAWHRVAMTGFIDGWVSCL